MRDELAAVLRDPLAAWPAPLVTFRDAVGALLVAAILVAAVRVRMPLPGLNMRRLLGCVAVLAIAAHVVILAMYPFGIAYNDHAEPTITMIAWWGTQGRPFYPDWDRGQGLYGLIYGPLNFQLIGWALRVGQSVFASKLPGVLAGGLTVAVLFVGLRRVLPMDGWFRVLLLGAVVTIVAAFGSIGFWNRPEPFILLCAALGLVAFVRLRGVAACVAIGVAAGLATGFKLTAPLYFVGFALGQLAMAPDWRARLRMTAAGTVAWLVATGLPLLDPAVDLAGYAKYFVMASEHGRSSQLLMLNVLFGAVLLLPLLVLRWRAGRVDAWVAAGMAGSLLVVGVVGGKPGAGPHHLLGFLPCFAYLACRAYAERPAVSREGVAAVMFAALMFSHGPTALKQMRSIGGLIVLDEKRERREARDVARLAAAAPDAVMGQAGDDGYRAAFHRVQTAFHGAPAALLEIPAWMEMEKAGASRNLPTELVSGCAVRNWIIPNAGEPFSINGGYVYDRVVPVMSTEFRRTFMANYRPAETGQYFTLWRCSMQGEARRGTAGEPFGG